MIATDGACNRRSRQEAIGHARHCDLRISCAEIRAAEPLRRSGHLRRARHHRSAHRAVRRSGPL